VALVVEDGTGLANANSYVSVADADAYFSLRPNSAWCVSVTKKEQALRRATDYVDLIWGGRFFGRFGCTKTTTQALVLPLTKLNIVSRIVHAVCEYAVRAVVGPLMADASAGGVQVTKKKVGPLTLETTSSGVSSLGESYAQPDRLMSGFCRGGSTWRA
jgi:hypothetical protein